MRRPSPSVRRERTAISVRQRWLALASPFRLVGEPRTTMTCGLPLGSGSAGSAGKYRRDAIKCRSSVPLATRIAVAATAIATHQATGISPSFWVGRPASHTFAAPTGAGRRWQTSRRVRSDAVGHGVASVTPQRRDGFGETSSRRRRGALNRRMAPRPCRKEEAQPAPGGQRRGEQVTVVRQRFRHFRGHPRPDRRPAGPETRAGHHNRAHRFRQRGQVDWQPTPSPSASSLNGSGGRTFTGPWT